MNHANAAFAQTLTAFLALRLQDTRHKLRLTILAIAKPYLAAGSSTAGPSQPNTVGKSPVPTRAPTHGLVGLLQRLSNLNIDLMNHLGAIPETSSNSIGSPLQTEREKLVFIDVMSQICLGLPPSHTDTPEQTTDAKRILCSLNPASELLIFSTYLRLIEMNDIILRLMKDSIENKDTNSPIRYPFQIPDFTIGSFSLPSKTDTQSIILINVMDTMITRAREIVAEATAPKQTLGYRGDFQSFGGATLVIVPDLARSAIRVREDALVRMIEDLKKPISQSNV
ncbi:hypothetical protein F4805DRAFT_477874 [Annulohypoxylon moriforme]|nr:hypothetical protein F4805DRAFT_477874 [Annulohypoxylon moriforme]